MATPPISAAVAPVQYPAYQYNVLLHRTAHNIILESKAGTSLIFFDPVGRNTDSSLAIDKLKGDLSASFGNEIRRETALPVVGIMGIIQLLSARYLLVISEANTVGFIQGAPIYMVTKTTAIPIPRFAYITEEEKRLESKYLEMLASFLDSSGFYFSFTYDLTHSAQRTMQLNIREVNWDTVDRRFFWNYYLSEDLIKHRATEWIIPLMDGLVKIQNCRIKSQYFDYILISRRSCMRQGARYHTRGADPDGHVANFVETEQLISWEGHLSSFVETRGSIPVLWVQPGKGLKPRPIIEDYHFSRLAFQRHFDEQLRLYSKQICVSLVDQRGTEQDLAEAYEMHTLLLNNPNVKFVGFDFHKECGEAYERLSLLLDRVKDELYSFGYFLRGPDGSIRLQQTGGFRTNCVDCLDRTNVVQTLFARTMLNVQLNNLGILAPGECMEMFFDFETFFRNVWVENADVISKRYTGTGALKTELTKTGKKTFKGSVSDAVNSGKRYLLRNFKDSDRQEMMDLFLGKYKLMSDFEFRQTYTSGNEVKIWNTTKAKPDSKGATMVLELNGHTNTFIQFNPLKDHFKPHSIQHLRQIMRTPRYRGVKLVLDDSPLTKEYLFQNPLQREHFIQVANSIIRTAKFEHKNPPALPLPMKTESAPASNGVLIDFSEIKQQEVANQLGNMSLSVSPPNKQRRAGTFQPLDPAKFIPNDDFMPYGNDLSQFTISGGTAAGAPQTLIDFVGPEGVPPLPRRDSSSLIAGLTPPSDRPASVLPPIPPKPTSAVLPSPPVTSTSHATPAHFPSEPNFSPGGYQQSLSHQSFQGGVHSTSHHTPQFHSLQLPSPPSYQPTAASNNNNHFQPAHGIYNNGQPTQAYSVSTPPPYQMSPFVEVLNVFVGSWNMSRMNRLEPLDTWVPRGKHIYVFGTQNALFAPPSQYNFTCKMYWFLQLQQYLGPSYIPIGSAESETTNLIALIHEDLLFNVGNVSRSYCVIDDSMYNKSVKRSVREGLNALRVAISGQKPGENKEKPETKRIVGSCLIFWYKETSFCFLNCQRSELPAKLEEYELATDFDHVFKMGSAATAAQRRHQWVELYSDRECNISWRSLFGSGLSGLQPVPYDMIKEQLNCLYPPVGASFQLETTSADYVCLGYGYQIVLFNLRVGELVAPIGGNGMDLYLKFHAPFLNEESQTSIKRKVYDATWDEAVYLNPIFITPEYLVRKHIMIELRTLGFQIEEDVIGTGVLSLERTFGAQPEEFRIPLSCDDLPAGFVYGCIHTRILPPK